MCAVQTPRPRTAVISATTSSSESSPRRSDLELAAERVRGEVLHVLDLAPGEPGRTQWVDLGVQHLLWRGHLAAEDREHSAQDRGSGLGRELLADDRAQQYPEGVVALAAPAVAFRFDIGPIRAISPAMTGSASASATAGVLTPVTRALFALPPGRAPLGERRDALAEILRGKAGLAQLDQLALLLWRRRGKRASISIAYLLPRIESGALAAIPAARSSAAASSSPSAATSLTSPIWQARSAVNVRPVRKRSRVLATPTTSMKRSRPGVAVDQAELGGRHSQLRAGRADRRSQRTASSRPPPRQWPLIAARTG